MKSFIFTALIATTSAIALDPNQSASAIREDPDDPVHTLMH